VIGRGQRAAGSGQREERGAGSGQRAAVDDGNHPVTAPCCPLPLTSHRTLRHHWRRDRRAASGIVVTLLILMVAVGAMSMFMSIYVPIWGKDTEAAQLKRIQTQMLELKNNIDVQILAGKGSTYTTRLTIGDEGGPVFHITRAPGALRFRPETGVYMVSNTTDRNDSQGIARGQLTYSSANTYYVDQTFVYENGALLIVQGGRAVMKAGPHVEARREADGNYTVSITLVSLGGAATAREGTGDVQLETTLDVYDLTTYSGTDWTLGKGTTLNITTGPPSAWADFLNTALGRPDAGLLPADYSVTVGPGSVNATFAGVTRLELGIAIVEMQLRT